MRFKNFEARRTWSQKWGRHVRFSSLLLKSLFWEADERSGPFWRGDSKKIA